VYSKNGAAVQTPPDFNLLDQKYMSLWAQGAGIDADPVCDQLI